MTTENTTEDTNERNRSTQETARFYECYALHATHRMGYLTAPQIAFIMYLNSSQSQRLARRILARLVKSGDLLCNKSKVGTRYHYALSLSGARRLRDEYDLHATSGKDVIRNPSAHRDAANWAALRLDSEGMTVYTEREIQTNQAPFRMVAKKVPDALGIKDGDVTWVEVEACRRGGRDMQSLANWLVYEAFSLAPNYFIFLDPPKDTLHLRYVRFVLAADSARTFPDRLRTALVKLLINRNIDANKLAEDRIQFQFGTAPDAKVVSGFQDWDVQLRLQTEFN